MSNSPATWWVTQRGGNPVGPTETDTVVEGILEGVVPLDALVCPIGGEAWIELTEEPVFARAAKERRARRADEAEKTVMDFQPLPLSDAPTADDDMDEKTSTDAMPDGRPTLPKI